MSESRSTSSRSPRIENLIPSDESTIPPNDSAHTIVDDLTGWKEDDWNRMVELGSDAFARALRESEAAIDAMNPLIQPPQNNGLTDPMNTLSPSSAASVKTVESSAFEQWARRIANLQVLNFDDETRDDPSLEFPHPHFDDLMAQARAPLSLSSEAPEAQLLRYKVLLAQEEAKNVALEDRISRLQHELAACKASNDSLRQTNTALSEKQMQQMANSTGCTQGCGLVRVENERLKKHYANLKNQVNLCEQQLSVLTAQVSNHANNGSDAASFQTPTKQQPPASPSSESLPSAPLSPSAALPSTLFNSFPPTDSQQEDEGDASTSALALLRVRCALALARLSLRHQGEMDHLLHYKLHYLSLQNNIDDLESALDTERELREYEREESARNAASLAEARAAESSAQAVMANMAQQLQKYVGAQGLKVIIAPPSTGQPSVAAASASPQSVASGGLDADELFDSTSSNTASNANTPALGLTTPHRRSDATATPFSSFPSTVSLQSPTSNAAVVIGSPSPAPATSSSSGWGLSWILGSASKEKQAALAAAEQARIIMATQAGSNPPSAKK